MIKKLVDKTNLMSVEYWIGSDQTSSCLLFNCKLVVEKQPNQSTNLIRLVITIAAGQFIDMCDVEEGWVIKCPRCVWMGLALELLQAQKYFLIKWTVLKLFRRDDNFDFRATLKMKLLGLGNFPKGQSCFIRFCKILSKRSHETEIEPNLINNSPFRGFRFQNTDYFWRVWFFLFQLIAIFVFVKSCFAGVLCNSIELVFCWAITYSSWLGQ